jgi:hypothetical protein
MVNIGLNLGSLLGLLQVLGSLAYFVVSIGQITAAVRSRRDTDIALRIFQFIFAPVMLLLSGGILFLQGWRLDPILQFQQFLMSMVIGYLVLLDLGRMR